MVLQKFRFDKNASSSGGGVPASPTEGRSSIKSPGTLSESPVSKPADQSLATPSSRAPGALANRLTSSLKAKEARW